MNDGQYERILKRSPFPVDEYQNDLKENLQVLVTTGILSTREAASFVVSNPSIPKLYALLKTHNQLLRTSMQQRVKLQNIETSGFSQELIE